MRDVLLIGVEGNRSYNLDRHGPDFGRESQFVEHAHDLAVEIGDRACAQRYCPPIPVGGGDDQLVVDKVEVDRKPFVGVRDQAGGQTACRHIQHDVPQWFISGVFASRTLPTTCVIN
jgi:hypothetical protein